MAPSRPTASRAVGRIERLAGQHEDERAFRQAVLGELRRDVGFDAHVWLLCDPETEVGSSPLADVPGVGPDMLPGLIRWKYLTTVNRWTALEEPVATLVEATDGELSASAVHVEVLAGLGVTDVASMVLRDRFGCWGFLDLWRSHQQAAFTEAEIGVLGQVAAPITSALRARLARTFAPASPEAPPEGEPRVGPAVLLLSPRLGVRFRTDEAERYLRALLPTERDREAIPAAAYNVAAQLLAVEAGIDGHDPTARVHVAGRGWLTVRAARAGGGPHDDIAVTIEPASPAERRSMFARTHGLSARESELVEHLADGADTAEVARRMYLSEHTVQDHLKSIFAKTGVHHRRTLLARVVGR